MCRTVFLFLSLTVLCLVRYSSGVLKYSVCNTYLLELSESSEAFDIFPLMSPLPKYTVQILLKLFPSKSLELFLVLFFCILSSYQEKDNLPTN